MLILEGLYGGQCKIAKHIIYGYYEFQLDKEKVLELFTSTGAIRIRSTDSNRTILDKTLENWDK